MVRIRNKVGPFIFFMFDGLLLPVLTAKLMRRRVILSLASSSQHYFKNHTDSLLKTVGHLDALCYSLSDRIIVYSPNMVKLWELEKHKTKISIAHEHFLDLDTFGTSQCFTKRPNTIGYIGRFSHEKGTMNFIKSIPEVLKRKDDFDFFIGGDGYLKEEMIKNLDKDNLNRKVNLHGWISHDALPSHLNTLKLLVLPSDTEGLPNMMLEAMACGTPVLATPVGAIPDVIKDGKTGFIMEDNSPDCIARNIVRALNDPRLEEISINARALVEKEYAFEAAVELYRTCLADLG
ncbi:MAG: glycosyltransferase family 4 protein [bacterium]|nr:glycosyltransferase family 4 protein [bacterium]